MSDIVTVIASAATLLTAVAAFWTILEVKRQRESTYKPRLVVPSCRILVRRTDDRVTQADRMGVPFQDGYSLRLRNLGFGSAVDVVVNWYVDYDEVVRRIESMPPSSLFQISKTDFVDVRPRTPDFPVAFVSDKGQRQARFDYVPPSAADPSGQELPMPSLLANLLRVYLFLAWRSVSDDATRNQFAEIHGRGDLPISLEVQYLDLASSRHKARGKLAVEIGFAFAGVVHDEQWGEHVTCDLSVSLR